MSLLMSTFEGLTAEDFDNYLPPRWSSNLHNLGRMKTKARVMALGEALAEALGREGLTVEASSEIPSVWNGREVRDQWAYLLRDTETRKALAPVVAANLDLATRIKDPAEHHRHALMCVRLDHERLEVGLRINQHATVDLANLLGRAEAELGRLEQALGDLPDDITLDGEPVTVAGLKSAARAARGGEAEWLVVARTFERDGAIARGEAVRDAVKATAAALSPLFRFVLWTPENDHVGAGSKIEAFQEAVEAREQAEEQRKAAAEVARSAREEQARARTSAKVAAEEAWRRMQAEKRRKIAAAKAAEEAAEKAKRAAEAAAAAKRAAEAKAAEAQSEPQPEAEPQPRADAQPEARAGDAASEAAPSTAAPTKGEGRSDRRPARQSGAGRRGGRRSGESRRGAGKGKRAGKPAERRSEKRPGKASGGKPRRGAAPKSAPRAQAHSFSAGDPCRLTRGLFAGKQGVVKGPDKAGYYKVKVGPLEVSVSAHELEPIE